MMKRNDNVVFFDDPDGDEDIGAFRGPMQTRRQGESYEDFRARVRALADKTTDSLCRFTELEAEVERLRTQEDAWIKRAISTKEEFVATGVVPK